MAVRKREWTTKKGVTKTVYVSDYSDQEGKRRWKQFARKKDADAHNLQVRNEVKQGVHTPESKSLTLRQAANKWLETGEANKLEEATLRPYRNHVDLHIIPVLGDIKISKLNAPAVERFKTELMRTRSHAMAKRVLGDLKAILTDMKRQGYIAQNVADAVQVINKARDKERVEIPTKAEIQSILRQAEATAGVARALLTTATFTGLRASELRGLAWEHVDFKTRHLTVARRADERGNIGSPKSAAGRRKVPMSPMVVSALREWKLQCPKNAKGQLDLVFPNGSGKVENHSNIVNRLFNPIQIRTGVIQRSSDEIELLDGDGCEIKARYNFHCLRHFYASWIIEQNFIPKRVQALLGHSSIQMTYDIYGHLFPNPEDDHARLAAAEAFFATSLQHVAAESSEHHEDSRHFPA